MSENRKHELEERIARLEAKVDKLEKRLRQETSPTDDTVVVDLNSNTGEEPVQGHQPARKAIQDKVQTGENWLNRLGIGLLLLGVAFLFKYSIDQGWLIPPVRSAIGLGTGLALFVSGLQLSESRTPMKQILMGGGIAAFYITGFATFQLYNFIPQPVIWAFMIIVTLLTLSLSLQQNDPVLSVIGTLGGLGTPFMLYTGSGSLVSLVIYTGLILAGAGIIYLYRGWKPLLWTMAAGGWLVLSAGLINSLFNTPGLELSGRLSLQAGVVIILATVWILPVVRELLLKRDPKQWSDRFKGNETDIHAAPTGDAHVQVMALLIPIISFIYSMAVWDIESEAWGVIAMACSLVIGYTYLPLQAAGLKNLGSTHGFTGLILLTLSFFLLVDGNLLFIILAFEGLGLRVVAHAVRDKRISAGSHILFTMTALWLLDSLFDPPSADLVILNIDGLTELFITGIAGLAVPFWLREKNSRLIYRLAAHLALLVWFAQQFSLVENGQAFVTLSWGIYAILLLVPGLMNDVKWLRMAGMGTIFLVVGKLFLVDLSQLDALWRILLFMGFGAVFLLIGYFVQTKFSGGNPETGELGN